MEIDDASITEDMVRAGEIAYEHYVSSYPSFMLVRAIYAAMEAEKQQPSNNTLAEKMEEAAKKPVGDYGSR